MTELYACMHTRFRTADRDLRHIRCRAIAISLLESLGEHPPFHKAAPFLLSLCLSSGAAASSQ